MKKIFNFIQSEIAITFIIVMIICVMITACTTEDPIIEGSIDRVGQEIKVTTHFYDNPSDLRRKYAIVHNVSLRLVDNGLQGFAVWHEWPNGEPENTEFECQIHSIKPKRIDDRHVTTLGHELLHCLYGTYH